MINYFYDCYQILCKVYSDKTFLKQAISETVIEEKNRALTVKTCYGVLDKDIELSYYISCLTEKTPKQAIRTVLKIAMYAVKYLEKHIYAVTQNAVELVKKLGKGGAAGFVNAFLRRFSFAKFVFPSDPIKSLSIRYSYPEFAIKKLADYYGLERAEKIIAAENVATCLSFFETDGEEYLKKLNINYENTPFDNVFTAKNFVRNSDYDKGIYTFQALGSVAICDVVERGGSLLDSCAAPGGKSVRLSYKFDKVTSWDIHPHRVELIREYKERMRRDNIFAEVRDAKIYDAKYEKAFDAVLCDAPCSGFGVVGDNPDIKLNREEKNVNSLIKEQLAILKTVSRYVKKGGSLYYSTCSIFPCENIMIIDKFMSDIKGFELQDISSPLANIKINGSLQFLPDISEGQGFYIAKLKRVK